MREKCIIQCNNEILEYSNEYSNDDQFQKSVLSLRTSAENESIAPIVLITIPEQNNTLIVLDIFYVIVNITDDNPPLPGNVSVEISNLTTSLFNASMIFTVASQWYFRWANITSYANGETYIIRVRAFDSSANKNMGISTEVYILLDIPPSNTPGAINAILYIIAACVLFALIMAYFSRKQLRTISSKQSP
ncbi:MAG: hypothetical protein ACW990_01810 [Promethearchaeota archaeon]